MRRDTTGLGETDGRHAAILEAALDAVITMDHEGKVVEFNSAAERIFGYRRGDAAGRSLADLIIPARLRAEHWRGLARYLATGEGPVLGKRLEMPAMRADGTEFPAELSIVRITTEGPPLFTGYLRDLTVEKRSEDAIRASEERFRTLVEMSSDGIFLGDLEGRILYASASLFRVMGYSSDELVGRSGFELVHPDDLEMTEGVLRGAVDRPGEHVPFLLRARHKDGSWRYVEGFCTNHFHNPAVQAVVVNLRDVTDQRRLEAHILHAQKLESLGVLVGGIAHEFNNLLQAVVGNASLALMQVPDESPLCAVLRDIERAGERGADLTRQMFAYAGKSQIVVDPLRLDTLVHEMTDLLRTALSKTVDLRLDLKPATIVGDAAQVRQVVMNLVTNASEAMEGHAGVIVIRTGTRNADATHLHHVFAPNELPAGLCGFVEIEDSGCGMSEEVLARVFDPFFTTKFTGQGLGLAAALGIVRGHGGVINVASTPGRTVFELLFPCTTPAPAAASEIAGGAASLVIPQMRGREAVLVIDDDPAVRTFAQRVLERVGFTVLTAANGREGLEEFAQRRQEIVAVLVDLTMPQLDGMDVFRELHAAAPDMPVLIMSGYSEQEVSTRFAGTAVGAFIQKPFHSRELLARMFQLLPGGKGAGTQ